MNKIRRRMSLGLILSALFALTIGFASCSSGSGIDYFTKDEVVDEIPFNNCETPVPCYNFETLFDEEDLAGDTKYGILFICDSYDNKHWSYIVQYEIHINDDYRVRRVYVKSKSDSLKVFNDICNNFNRNLSSTYRSASAYYKIDYELDVLMSDYPVSFNVFNMTGKTFGKDEIIESVQLPKYDGTEYTRRTYERRRVYPFTEQSDGTFTAFDFVVMDNGLVKEYPYVLYAAKYFFKATGEYSIESDGIVKCKTKAEVKTVLQQMLDAYKNDPDRFLSMPKGYSKTQYIESFDINTLLNY